MSGTPRTGGSGRPKNWKLVVDPLLKKGLSHKVHRVEGVVPGTQVSYNVIGPPTDPRPHVPRFWSRSEPIDLPLLSLKIDSDYIGTPPPKEVSFFDLNDNVNQHFLTELCRKCGEIDECKIYYHPQTKRHMGLARATFKKMRYAYGCVKRYNDTSVMGKKIQVVLDPFAKLVRDRVRQILNPADSEGEAEETEPDRIAETKPEPPEPRKTKQDTPQPVPDDPPHSAPPMYAHPQSSTPWPKHMPTPVPPPFVTPQAHPSPYTPMHQSTPIPHTYATTLPLPPPPPPSFPPPPLPPERQESSEGIDYDIGASRGSEKKNAYCDTRQAIDSLILGYLDLIFLLILDPTCPSTSAQLDRPNSRHRSRWDMEKHPNESFEASSASNHSSGEKKGKVMEDVTSSSEDEGPATTDLESRIQLILRGAEQQVLQAVHEEVKPEKRTKGREKLREDEVTLPDLSRSPANPVVVPPPVPPPNIPAGYPKLPPQRHGHPLPRHPLPGHPLPGHHRPPVHHTTKLHQAHHQKGVHPRAWGHQYRHPSPYPHSPHAPGRMYPPHHHHPPAPRYPPSHLKPRKPVVISPPPLPPTTYNQTTATSSHHAAVDVAGFAYGRVLGDLRQVLRRDMKKKLLESQAFPPLDSWVHNYLALEERIRNVSEPQEKAEPNDESKSSQDISAGSGRTSSLGMLFNESGLVVGLKASLPKMPSFKRKMSPQEERRSVSRSVSPSPERKEEEKEDKENEKKKIVSSEESEGEEENVVQEKEEKETDARKRVRSESEGSEATASHKSSVSAKSGSDSESGEESSDDEDDDVASESGGEKSGSESGSGEESSDEETESGEEGEERENEAKVEEKEEKMEEKSKSEEKGEGQVEPKEQDENVHMEVDKTIESDSEPPQSILTKLQKEINEEDETIMSVDGIYDTYLYDHCYIKEIRYCPPLGILPPQPPSVAELKAKGGIAFLPAAGKVENRGRKRKVPLQPQTQPCLTKPTQPIQAQLPVKPKAVFPQRTLEEQEKCVWDSLCEGLDSEDMKYLSSAFDSRQSTLGNSVIWVQHPINDDANQIARKRRRPEDSQSHKSGSARTEGFYRLSKKDKRTFMRRAQRGNEGREGNEGNVYERTELQSQMDVAAARQQVQLGREARLLQRRLLTTLGVDPEHSELLKFNQLKFRKKMIRFSRSSIHGWGLFALEPIAHDEMIVEYIGQQIRLTVAEKREVTYEKMGIGSSYLFRIDSDSVIDATKCGNMARFINHSCSPSCYAKIVTMDGFKRIVIYSKREINTGDEITYDYKFPLEDEKIACLCGAPNCRGSLN